MFRSICLVLSLAWSLTMAAQDPSQSAQQALQQQPKVCKSATTTSKCHSKYPAGCNDSGVYDAYLDYFKNLLLPADSQPAEAVDPQKLAQLESNTPSALKAGNHRDFSAQFVQDREGEIVSATGYLYYVMETGGHKNKQGQTVGESSNCDLWHPGQTDFHIGIGFDKDLAAKIKAADGPLSKDLQHQADVNSMVVEMTPHYRARFEPGWTLAKLHQLAGAQVKVVGQLIADNDHYEKTQDCGISGSDKAKCWRMSIWEIHPVTAFYVCTSQTACTDNGSGWTKLED